MRGWENSNGKSVISMDIPQNLSQLKRPELQKLCKQLGLRANGKNVDMVRSLEEYRETRAREERNAHTHTSSTTPEELEGAKMEGEGGVPSGEEGEGGGKDGGELIELSEKEASAPQGGDERERKREKGKGRGRKQLTGRGKGSGRERRKKKRESDGEFSPAPSSKSESRPTEKSPNSEEQSLKGRDDQPVQRESLDNVMETMEQGASGCSGGGVSEEGGYPVQNERMTKCITENEGTGRGAAQDMVPPVVTHTNDMEVKGQGEASKEEQEEEKEEKENEEGEEQEHEEEVKEEEFGSSDIQQGFELPDEFSAGRKRRRDTFSVSPQSDPLSLEKENGPKRRRRDTYSLSPPSAASESQSPHNSAGRKRRCTHSISPNSSLLLSGGATPVPMVTEGTGQQSHGVQTATESPLKSTRKSTSEEMMALLDKRVEERKADPSYVPPPSLLSTVSFKQSHIPVSKTTAKFNRAHKRSFKAMTSIVDYAEQRKRRIESLQKVSTPAPPAKRQRVDQTTPASLAKPPGKAIITKPRVHPSDAPQFSKESTRSSTAKTQGPTIVKPIITSAAKKSALSDTSTSSVKKPHVPLNSNAEPKPANADHFEPRLSTKGANFNFTKTGTKTPNGGRDHAPKTPAAGGDGALKPFQFNAETQAGRVKESEKDRRKTFKPYRGKLPDFNFSIY